MSLKQFTIDFRELGKEKSFRYDVDFVNFQNDFLAERFYSFNDLFSFASGNEVDVEKLNDDFFYSEIGNVSKEGDVEPVKLNFNERKEEEENYYKKIEKGDILQVKENEILLSKVRPNLKKYVFIDRDNKDYFYTSAFIHLVPKKLNKIVYYSLRTIFYQNLIAISRQGKGYPTLKENDFLYLKFDKKIIDKLSVKQGQVVAQIEPIEKKIKELKNQITPAQEIINKVFAREFKFDLEKFEELKKEKFFDVDFSNFNDYKLRCNFKSNNFYIKDLLNFLHNKHLLLKEFLKEKIISGDTPKYSENGKFRVVKTINVNKNGFIEKFDEDKFIDKTNKYLEENNILVTTHGEGRGKFGIYKDEEQATTDANCSIIKINESKINILYLNYYFNSFFAKEFFYYLESETKSVRYMKNEDLENMPVIFSKINQQKIVDEIKAELDKQEERKQKIESERTKIDEIIKKAVV